MFSFFCHAMVIQLVQAYVLDTFVPFFEHKFYVWIKGVTLNTNSHYRLLQIYILNINQSKMKETRPYMRLFTKWWNVVFITCIYFSHHLEFICMIGFQQWLCILPLLEFQLAHQSKRRLLGTCFYHYCKCHSDYPSVLLYRLRVA